MAAPPKVQRLTDGPIIGPGSDPSIGVNIQGPSLIRVPEWVTQPLGRYYLYFADHKGAYIRLAYADRLIGPWRVYAPGSLQLADSHFPTDAPAAPPNAAELIAARARATRLPHDILLEMTTPHIASPDVHVDHERQRIVMYFHGLSSFGKQESRVALSVDGIRFEARKEVLGRTYLRVFDHDAMRYGLAMPGQFYRSRDGLSSFEEGPRLFNPNMRHCAVLRRGGVLHVFWTQVGDVPERILWSTVALTPDWHTWHTSEPVEVLRPERDWEGADAPLVPSMRSVAYGHVNQLRDPAIFVDGGCSGDGAGDPVYLLYAVAGESGLAIASLHGI